MTFLKTLRQRVKKQPRGYFFDPTKTYFKHEPRLTIPKHITGLWGEVPVFNKWPSYHHSD